MVFGLWLVFRKAQAAIKTNKVCDLAPGPARIEDATPAAGPGGTRNEFPTNTKTVLSF